MHTIGVTGGIGSGKSLVCNIFRILGVPVYNADEKAGRIMENNAEIHEALIGYFGDEVFQGGILSKPLIAQRIFSNEKDRNYINSLVHPAVQNDFLAWTGDQESAAYVIEEAALLFESGAWQKLDMTILVSAPVDLRVTRIMQRDGLKNREIRARMASQISTAEAEKMADLIILNDEKAFVLPQVIAIHQKILKGL